MSKISKNLQLAIDNLKIHDIYLKSSQTHCDERFDPKLESIESFQIQQMHHVERSELVPVNNDKHLVRIFIRMGTRWIDEPNDDEITVKAYIEADYIAEYQLINKIDENAIEEFALKNASYHVWPYWREFLSSQCERMRLPRVVLPMVQFSK